MGRMSDLFGKTGSEKQGKTLVGDSTLIVCRSCCISTRNRLGILSGASLRVALLASCLLF